MTDSERAAKVAELRGLYGALNFVGLAIRFDEDAVLVHKPVIGEVDGRPLYDSEAECIGQLPEEHGRLYDAVLRHLPWLLSEAEEAAKAREYADILENKIEELDKQAHQFWGLVGEPHDSQIGWSGYAENLTEVATRHMSSLREEVARLREAVRMSRPLEHEREEECGPYCPGCKSERLRQEALEGKP